MDTPSAMFRDGAANERRLGRWSRRVGCQRAELRDRTRENANMDAMGRITFTAVANAVKGSSEIQACSRPHTV